MEYQNQTLPYYLQARDMFQSKVNGINEGIIRIIILKNDILPLLGLDWGYTVQYSTKIAEGYI